MPGLYRRRGAIAWSLLAALVVGGCAGDPGRPRAPGADAAVAVAAPGVPASGRVLDDLRAGVAAMERGAPTVAAAAFDAATAGIAAAGAARVVPVSALDAVDRGAFAGEPHERAMAYYYRGLLHLAAGDYRAAGAAFRGGARHAAPGDGVALLAFLEGWAAHCGGDRPPALRAFRRAQALRPVLGEPDADHNVLLVAETGRAPVKVAGPDGLPRFRRGAGFAERRASFVVDRARIAAAEAADLYLQASHRAATPGYAPAAAEPRSWDNLPDRVHLVTLAHPAAPHTVVARFEDDGGRTVAERAAAVARRGRCSVAWARSPSAAAVTAAAPGAAPAAGNAGGAS